MTRLRFESFLLDCESRLLLKNGAAVELNARYLDALILLAREPGKLVTKDRFMDDVWRGVPVGDEALTQCIKTLRRQLGDDAANPRFIETVPKHGYRFIAPVTGADDTSTPSPAAVTTAPSSPAWRDVALLGGAGTLGGGAAGLVGGLLYGFAVQPAQSQMGALSLLLVLMILTGLIALLGGAGVAFGIALAGYRSRWSIVGGAAGGLAVGAFVKLLGLDAFRLLLGHAPGDITGALEGLVLGGAVGLGSWLARGSDSLRVSATIAALCGAAAGIAITLMGGRLMAGSLDALARSFPESQVRLDHVGRIFGEAGFGPIAQAVTGGLEGALFGGCIVGAMLLARRLIGNVG
jgi:DNA-binding winged helix-turn-helix (wHTH) protein